MHLRFVKNTYFLAVKNIKRGNSCIGFLQIRKLTMYEMTSVRKSLTLLHAEKFGNINLSAGSFIKNNL